MCEKTLGGCPCQLRGQTEGWGTANGKGEGRAKGIKPQKRPVVLMNRRPFTDEGDFLFLG